INGSSASPLSAIASWLQLSASNLSQPVRLHDKSLRQPTLDAEGRGYSFGANYTWSHCIGNPANTLLNAGAGGTGLYIAPTRDGDRGDCLRIPGINAIGEDRRHAVNMTGLVNSPKFSNHLLGMLAGN